MLLILPCETSVYCPVSDPALLLVPPGQGHGAGAAGTLAARKLRPSQPQVLPQELQQGPIGAGVRYFMFGA